MSRVLGAIENGAPFADDLDALDPTMVPEALAARAEDGVPTLLALQDSFPDVARRALDASLRSEVGGSMATSARSCIR